MVEIARSHETQMRLLLIANHLPGKTAVEGIDGRLVAPQTNHQAVVFRVDLARAGSHTGAHEVGLQLQRIIKVKKEELHPIISWRRV